MKGRRRELVREELHENLKLGYGVSTIHSEYGMTELTSQAYATSDGNYTFPEWTQVLIRDTNDPFSYVDMSRSGGVNVIDLANISSCAFIETMDLGQKKSRQAFSNTRQI